jgi:hypothetical protein
VGVGAVRHGARGDREGFGGGGVVTLSPIQKESAHAHELGDVGAELLGGLHGGGSALEAGFGRVEADEVVAEMRFGEQEVRASEPRIETKGFLEQRLHLAERGGGESARVVQREGLEEEIVGAQARVGGVEDEGRTGVARAHGVDGFAAQKASEVGGELGGGGVARGRSFGEAAERDRFDRLGDGRNDGARTSRWFLGDLAQHFGQRGGGVRGATSEKVIEQSTETVDVDGRLTAGVAGGLFRRHVGRRADEETELRIADARVEILGEAEVGDFRAAVEVEEDVGRFEVAMNDSVLVRENAMVCATIIASSAARAAATGPSASSRSSEEPSTSSMVKNGEPSSRPRS